MISSPLTGRRTLPLPFVVLMEFSDSVKRVVQCFLMFAVSQPFPHRIDLIGDRRAFLKECRRIAGELPLLTGSYCFQIGWFIDQSRDCFI